MFDVFPRDIWFLQQLFQDISKLEEMAVEFQHSYSSEVTSNTPDREMWQKIRRVHDLLRQSHHELPWTNVSDSPSECVL